MVDGRLVDTHPGRFDDDMLLKLTQAPRSCERRARGRTNTRGKYHQESIIQCCSELQLFYSVFSLPSRPKTSPSHSPPLSPIHASLAQVQTSPRAAYVLTIISGRNDSSLPPSGDARRRRSGWRTETKSWSGTKRAR